MEPYNHYNTHFYSDFNNLFNSQQNYDLDLFEFDTNQTDYSMFEMESKPIEQHPDRAIDKVNRFSSNFFEDLTTVNKDIHSENSANTFDFPILELGKELFIFTETQDKRQDQQIESPLKQINENTLIHPSKSKKRKMKTLLSESQEENKKTMLNGEDIIQFQGKEIPITKATGRQLLTLSSPELKKKLQCFDSKLKNRIKAKRNQIKITSISPKIPAVIPIIQFQGKEIPITEATGEQLLNLSSPELKKKIRDFDSKSKRNIRARRYYAEKLDSSKMLAAIPTIQVDTGEFIPITKATGEQLLNLDSQELKNKLQDLDFKSKRSVRAKRNYAKKLKLSKIPEVIPTIQVDTGEFIPITKATGKQLLSLNPQELKNKLQDLDFKSKRNITEKRYQAKLKQSREIN